ncbi:MAG: LamG domain-containing protein [Candidatus Micrarchaeota archaeon]|nr:LamG domain-containing protein [Candidatus Micrarchaeota archaeon]
MGARLQSAMEYLMTYGWAILAIAIVMVSLYSLGIFNSGSLQPVATPGSCEVVRTVAQTSLAGQCSGLIPKYVGVFGGSGSYIRIPSNLAVDAGAHDLTVSLWFYAQSNDAGSTYIGLLGKGGQDNSAGGYEFFQHQSSSISFRVTQTGNGAQYGVTVSLTSAFLNNTWYHVVGIVNRTRNTAQVCVDAVCGSTANISTQTTLSSSADLKIGNDGAGPLNGSMANVQMYNVSLDNATIKGLYKEGIGGVPIDVKHLTGWWPLNGNGNDYSGNNNHGALVNVKWNANWQSSYSPPSS